LESNQSSYRQIFKATSLFGGVQVFNIVISIIRSKIIAVLLGPAGMGLAGLLTSTTGLLSSMTNFGLGTSAVREVAEANESGDRSSISKVVTLFRRLVWMTGLLGAVMTFAVSPWLSKITFGNHDYISAFRWLSITLLFNQLANGQNVLLQGMRKLHYLAKANVAGSIIGLLISLPLYYIWHIDGIVPAIIFTSIASLLIAVYYASKIKIEKIKIRNRYIFGKGKGMLKMGFLINLSGLITVSISYIVKVYISHFGGFEDVGLYSAGFSLITTYVGLVFTAMSTDYYPRLSGVAHNNNQAKILINNQAELAILILAPILSVFFIFINYVVIILYSPKFSLIGGMIQWAALGMYFKAASWSIGMILLAKEASNLFFWNELIANAYMLVFNIIGYHLLGLDGLGISFFIGYVFYLLQIYLVVRTKFQICYNNEFIHIFLSQFVLGLLCFGIVKFITFPLALIAGVPIIIISALYSCKEMEKRMALSEVIKKKIIELNSKFSDL
jgi:O-antigen/teichoic acid export membrane protein